MKVPYTKAEGLRPKAEGEEASLILTLSRGERGETPAGE